MLGAKGLAAALTAILLVPAASANLGRGRQRQRPGASCICGRRREDSPGRSGPGKEGGERESAGGAAGGAGRRSRGRSAGPCVPNPAQVCKAQREEMGDRPSPRSTASTTTRQTRSGSAFPRKPASGTVPAPAMKRRRPRPTIPPSLAPLASRPVRRGARVLPPGRAVDEGVALARDNLRRVLRRRAGSAYARVPRKESPSATAAEGGHSSVRAGRCMPHRFGLAPVGLVLLDRTSPAKYSLVERVTREESA